MRTRRSASTSSDPVSSSKAQEARHGRRPVGTAGHTSVLLHEVLYWLDPKSHDVIVDATLGGGGHAKELLKGLGKSGVFIGIDAEAAAFERSRTALEVAASASGARLELVNANFRDITSVLSDLKVPKISKALFDLGWSSYQLSNGRGFSFMKDEPLLMTYTETILPTTLTAEKIVNTWKEESIADVLYGWGEERNARRIARKIVEERVKKPIQTTFDLVRIIESVAARTGKIHPATRTFQALRIAVNDEFGAIKRGLKGLWDALEEGGRIAVISFHSSEDREVKHVMREWEKAGVGKQLTKSPVVASRDELRANPRARSAKLRIIEKVTK